MFQNSDYENDVVWFVSDKQHKKEDARKTIVEWEAYEPDQEFEIDHIFEVDNSLIEEVTRG